MKGVIAHQFRHRLRIHPPRRAVGPRDALNTVACDYLIHCFVEAVRRHDPAKLPWR